MADEIEDAWGSEPKESKPEEQTDKVESTSAADTGDAVSDMQADAAMESSQKEAVDTGDPLVADASPEPETLNATEQAGSDAASMQPDDAMIASESDAPIAGTQEAAADEASWERETVSPSASVPFQAKSTSPDEYATAQSASNRSNYASSESASSSSSNATQSGHRSGTSAGNGSRNGGAGLPGGWGADLNKPGLGLLYDVELDATLQFGSKEMLLRDVLELGPGDVVELDRHIAEPVDLVVGDRIVARGEVVVASGNFALRVTEVATPQMRLESIRCLF